jgi:hypothetical protein
MVCQEVEVPMPRKDERNAGSFAMPLAGIVILLAFYWLLTDWHQLPPLISATLTNFHMPT